MARYCIYVTTENAPKKEWLFNLKEEEKGVCPSILLITKNGSIYIRGKERVSLARRSLAEPWRAALLNLARDNVMDGRSSIKILHRRQYSIATQNKNLDSSIPGRACISIHILQTGKTAPLEHRLGFFFFQNLVRAPLLPPSSPFLPLQFWRVRNVFICGLVEENIIENRTEYLSCGRWIHGD